jgi:hypothetical protein
MSRHPLVTCQSSKSPLVSPTTNEVTSTSKDYVVLPTGENNDLPPLTLILDFTLTHDRFGSSHLHPVVNFLTHMIRDDTLRDPDDPLKAAGNPKIIQHCYRKLYVDRQETIVSHCEHFIGSLRLVSGLYTVAQFCLLNSVSNSV